MSSVISVNVAHTQSSFNEVSVPVYCTYT